jgi:phosphatidylglycerophosphatase C
VSNWVLIDYDGTLTTRDTTRYLVAELLAVRPWRIVGILRHVAHMLLAGEEQALQSAKYRLIGHLVRGFGEAQLMTAVTRFSKKANRLRRLHVAGIIAAHLRKGVSVLVVTASPDFAVRHALADLNVEVIGTSFSMENSRYTGQISGVACFGSNKPACIASWMQERNIKASFVESWSDGLSDLPMMRLAADRYWICDSLMATKVRQADPAANIIPKEACL